MTSSFATVHIAACVRMRAGVGVRALVDAPKQGVGVLPPRGPGPGRP